MTLFRGRMTKKTRAKRCRSRMRAWPSVGRPRCLGEKKRDNAVQYPAATVFAGASNSRVPASCRRAHSQAFLKGSRRNPGAGHCAALLPPCTEYRFLRRGSAEQLGKKCPHGGSECFLHAKAQNPPSDWCPSSNGKISPFGLRTRGLRKIPQSQTGKFTSIPRRKNGKAPWDRAPGSPVNSGG